MRSFAVEVFPQITQKPKILVIDDTPYIRELLSEILHEQDYEIRLAPNGALGLLAAENEFPDLIILDIDMPDMDGYEVCQRLKSYQSLKKIPVIFISAINDTQKIVKAFESGGVDYITKPFHFEEVLARVDTHLTLRRLQMEIERHNYHLEELVQEKMREISASHMSTILALAKLAESRDDDTGKHLERVQTHCKFFSIRLKDHPRFAAVVDDAFIENIYHAAPLHDIGKVGIPDEILLKPDELTPYEFEIMKTHTTIGAQTLEVVSKEYPKNDFINMGITIARSHHENWDGTGYPDGLERDEIPLEARIMSIVDAYDALRSKRPYKNAFPHEETIQIIIESSGTSYSPEIVDEFIRIEGEIDEIYQTIQE